MNHFFPGSGLYRNIGPLQFFSKIRGYIRRSRCTTVINDTGCKWQKSSIRGVLKILCLDTYGFSAVARVLLLLTSLLILVLPLLLVSLLLSAVPSAFSIHAVVWRAAVAGVLCCWHPFYSWSFHLCWRPFCCGSPFCCWRPCCVAGVPVVLVCMLLLVFLLLLGSCCF
jgi:hypothetical protein